MGIQSTKRSTYLSIHEIERTLRGLDADLDFPTQRSQGFVDGLRGLEAVRSGEPYRKGYAAGELVRKEGVPS